tara:strand:+ start:6017 stop:7264 length:1248 start_codon:yes stop_codon:yes gene_type:complete
MSEQTKTTEPVKQEGDFKIKSKKKTPKNLGHASQNEITKVDLSKPEVQGEVVPEVMKVKIPNEAIEKDAISKSETGGLPEDQRTDTLEKVDGQVRTSESVEVQESKEEDSTVEIEEIIEEKTEELTEKVEEAVKETVKTGKPLPENIENLVSFMEQTGGTVEDYVRLNHDYDKTDDVTLLNEYYKQTKPHLDGEEIAFLLEDNFHFDEEVDEARDVRKKKLAFKEEVAKARKELEVLKDKYYQEIKLRPGVSQEQQKATDFFDRYNKQQKVMENNHQDFKNKTSQMFNAEFQGFDFELGQKKFRYKISNPIQTGETQADISKFINKYTDENGVVTDPKGYHKSLYAAMNADKIANHFYEQGKADGVKNIVNSSKNITNEKPRQVADGNVFVQGLKVKSISGLDSSKLKIKTKRFN